MCNPSIRLKTEQERIDEVNTMTHEEMARALRFAPVGDPMFQHGPVYEAFKKRFYGQFGGMTSNISKHIGW